MFLFYYEREARQMRKFKLFLAILASVVLLTACTGGGNSKSDGKENTGGNAGNSAQTETTAKEVEVTELIKVTVPEGLKATEFQGFWAVMKEGEPWRVSIIDYEFDRYPIIDERSQRILWDATRGIRHVTVDRFNSQQAAKRPWTEKDISKFHWVNTRTPSREESPEYQELAANDFADFRLEVGGMVSAPASFSLDELKAIASQSQITMHTYMQSWTGIAK